MSHHRELGRSAGTGSQQIAMPDIHHFSDSEESFHSFDDNEPSEPPSTQPHGSKSAAPPPEDTPDNPIVHRFSPEEEASLLSDSNALKLSANQLFGSGSFDNAIQAYDRALAACPNYLDYEIAVLRSNVAACHLKLREWKEALASASKGVENLERLEPLPPLPRKPAPKVDLNDDKPASSRGTAPSNAREPATAAGRHAADDAANGDEDDDDDTVEELSSALEARIARLQASGHSLAEVRKLQTKLLTRRAQAREQLGGWTELQGAEEDYGRLRAPALQATLSAGERRQVEEGARRLGPKLAAAREREMAEMMGKLKGLGNSLLGNFGLSTDNFKFVKDEKTGGYSMNFEQNPQK
nr:tetratricopeptide repeat protein 1 [Quercus suber]